MEGEKQKTDSMANNMHRKVKSRFYACNAPPFIREDQRCKRQKQSRQIYNAKQNIMQLHLNQTNYKNYHLHPKLNSAQFDNGSPNKIKSYSFHKIQWVNLLNNLD